MWVFGLLVIAIILMITGNLKSGIIAFAGALIVFFYRLDK